MKTRKNETLPSISPFCRDTGKNSQTLLDRTVKAMKSVCSPWRKKASHAWEIAVKLNVKIHSTELPGCSALTWCHAHLHPFLVTATPIRSEGKSTDLPQADPSCRAQGASSEACGLLLVLLNTVGKCTQHKIYYLKQSWSVQFGGSKCTHLARLLLPMSISQTCLSYKTKTLHPLSNSSFLPPTGPWQPPRSLWIWSF